MSTSISDVTATSVDVSGVTKQKTDGLGRDAFLKLLVAQLSHQDPLKPTDGTEFVTQLAQFSAVEQAVSQTARLDTLSAQLTGISANESVSLIGKQVTVRGQNLLYDGTNAATATVKLGGAAAEVKVTVTDASGKVIRTINLGSKPAGPLDVSWDGRDDAGRQVGAGGYSFSVSAKSTTGASVEVQKDVTGVVQKVTFDKGYPVVVLDSGVTASISDLVSAGVAPANP